MNDIGVKITAAIAVLGLIVGLSLILAYPLMLLWNFHLVPAVSILREVGWIQMWAISILIGLLFKSLTPSGK